MIIKTQNDTKNFLLLRKGGFRLFDINSGIKTKNFSVKNLDINQNISNEIKITENSKQNFSKSKSNEKTNHKNFILSKISSTYSKINNNRDKYGNYKKYLFRKNILSTEKNFLLEDYMRKKELDLMNDTRKKTFYEARKTFFSEKNFTERKTGYFNKENSFDPKNKFTLMIKDIESNFLLLKNKRNKKYKEYLLKKTIQPEKNSYKDLNEKLSPRNVFLRANKLFKNKTKNTFTSKNLKFLSCADFFNTYYPKYNNHFN
jgi:hypothetical protein